MKHLVPPGSSSLGLSTDRILLAAADCVAAGRKKSLLHLDIGSGHGDLITLLRRKGLVAHSAACDYTPTLMALPDVIVSVANLNTEALPFADASFDLITCTEVIEHLEHYRETLREMYRVLKPDGQLVLTTPNILNLKSRIRFLMFGFHNLFGPLHTLESNLHLTGGHINPVSSFYLSHSLIDAGFTGLRLSIDKRQSSSTVWLLLLYVPIKLFSKLIVRKEKLRYKTMDAHNEPYVTQINSIDVLLGRTIVVGCSKPG